MLPVVAVTVLPVPPVMVLVVAAPITLPPVVAVTLLSSAMRLFAPPRPTADSVLTPVVAVTLLPVAPIRSLLVADESVFAPVVDVSVFAAPLASTPAATT